MGVSAIFATTLGTMSIELDKWGGGALQKPVPGWEIAFHFVGILALVVATVTWACLVVPEGQRGYTHTHTQTHTHLRMIRTYERAYIHAHMHTHIYIHLCTHTYNHACMHAYKHQTSIFPYIHTSNKQEAS